MTVPASSPHPRFSHPATPVSLLRLPRCRGWLQHDLGLDLEQMHPVGDAVFSAKIDVPPGEWLIWVDSDFAMWIGARVDALPLSVRRRLEDGDAHSIPDLLNALADVGVWLREAALLIGDEWTPSRRADSALAEISRSVVSALSGIFIDRRGRSSRLELTRGGVCWTDCPALAVEWLLAAVELPVPA
jgi:hypothetical protein